MLFRSSNKTHTPLFVVYNLFQGGGACSRADLSFQNDFKVNSATNVDYKGSGYDIGHMANAEDFAYDCTLEKITFRFYNALPQTAQSNRGIWKSYETEIRKQSQTDHLLIICGGYSFTQHLTSNFKLKGVAMKKITQVLIPDYCFKIIKDLKTKQIKCYTFPNDNSDDSKEVQLKDLLVLLKYDTTVITNALK